MRHRWIIHSVSGWDAGEKLGLEKFLQDTAVHIFRRRLAHEVQDRGREIDQPGAFDLNSLPERLAVGHQNTVTAMGSSPFVGREGLVLNDFDRRFIRILRKTGAGGKEAGVPPIEGQIGGFIAVRAMKDFVPAENAFHDGLAGSWIS